MAQSPLLYHKLGANLEFPLCFSPMPNYSPSPVKSPSKIAFEFACFFPPPSATFLIQATTSSLLVQPPRLSSSLHVTFNPPIIYGPRCCQGNILKMSVWLNNSDIETLQCHLFAPGGGGRRKDFKCFLRIAVYTFNLMFHLICVVHKELLSFVSNGPCSSLPLPMLPPFSGIFTPTPVSFSAYSYAIFMFFV